MVDLIPNRAANSSLSAKKGDVLEIAFTSVIGSIPPSAAPSRDVSKVSNSSGTSLLRNDSVFFVLGAEKYANKFTSFADTESDDVAGGVLNYLPITWDSLLISVCPGDRRVLYLPPALFRNRNTATYLSALDSFNGDERGTLILDISVLSVNGMV